MAKTERPTNRRIVKNAIFQKWLAGFLLMLGVMALAAPAAQAETRTLKLYFVHTKERAEITFKRNGRYDQAGLKKINSILRDWRRNEPTKMDPRLLDAVWEAYRAVGARDYIHVVSGYRSAATNSMLRKRSNGVAQKSQHMLGKAMDFYIPGVPLQKLRDVGLKLEAGGVGYYPRSGSPFVHFDVGNVRHWPRMNRKELVSVFPRGKTLHVPSDGKPLPGYEQAVASYEARKKSGTNALALASASPTKGKSGGLLAALFGGGADEEEDNSESSNPISARVQKRSEPTRTAERRPEPKIRVVPPDQANPATVPFTTAPDEVEETPQMIMAALSVRDIPVPLFAPRPQAELGPQVDVGPVAVEEAPAMPTPAQPADIPFAMASVVPEESEARIPLPSHRPETNAADSALLAAFAPVPEGRPSLDDGAGELTLAALITAGEEDVGAAASTNGKGGRLTAAADAGTDARRQAVAALVQEKSAALAPVPLAVEQSKTTAKSDRAPDEVARPAPKPQVVTAQPEAARWAMGVDAQLAYAADGASIQHLSSTPSEVYATGFKRDTVVADASRFSGKAISFMPVARFQTN